MSRNRAIVRRRENDVRADRLIALTLLLQARGRVTADELAERLEVSARTIYRDLDALSAAGVPVYAERGKGGGVSLPDGYRLDLTALNRAEAGALLLSAVPGPLADLGVTDVLEGALRKLTAALPAASVQEAERARQRIHLDPAEWWQTREPVPHLRTLQEAVWLDRCVRLTYERRGGAAAPRLVDPYGLVAKASVWYLVGADVSRAAPATETAPARSRATMAVPRTTTGRSHQNGSSAMRVYRVSRVRRAELTEQPSARPADFDLAAFWSAWCAEFERNRPSYPVVLCLDPASVPVLRQQLGEGIQAQVAAHGRHDDQGRLILPLTFESLETACSRVLSFGPTVEVLSPRELRERVAQQAALVAAAYLRAAAPSSRQRS
jgi:predicted DNA-binding transcriptional regulator YafY